MAPWLNWIEYLTTDQKVTGLNPVGITKKIRELDTNLLPFFFMLAYNLHTILSVALLWNTDVENLLRQNKFAFLESLSYFWFWQKPLQMSQTYFFNNMGAVGRLWQLRSGSAFLAFRPLSLKATTYERRKILVPQLDPWPLNWSHRSHY